MGTVKHHKPIKKQIHRNPTAEKEFKNVYLHLSKVDLGPFRIVYDDDNDALYFQIKNRTDNFYSSVMQLTRAGVFSTTGAHNPSASIEDVGNS